MANKDARIKKSLIAESIIFAVVLGVLLTGAFILSGMDDSTLADKTALESANNAISEESSSLKALMGSQLEISSAYNLYIKNHVHDDKNPASDLLLNREEMASDLARLCQQYHLVSPDGANDNIPVTISPITDVTDSNFTLKTGIAVKSEVALSFGALTDASVYNFIEALQRQLHGIVVVNDLKLTRSGDVSHNILMDLYHHKITPMIKGDLSFVWVGIRPKTDVKAAEGSVNGR